MNEPVQTFWLQTEKRERHYVGFHLTGYREDEPCPADPKGNPHRLEIDVPAGVGYRSVQTTDDGYLELRYDDVVAHPVCQCGLRFQAIGSDIWSGSMSRWYTNPKTGKSSSHLHDVATPGAMWPCDWLIDRDFGDLKAGPGHSGILSVHYVSDWLGKRPPIGVMCPDGKHWIVDQKSSNGTGWTVTGDAYAPVPNLTAQPSIDTGTYHAWLQNGVFLSDPNCTPWTPK